MDYHKYPVPGKTSVKLTKPCNTSKDLSLAYTPGVAYPCLDIENAVEESYELTNRGNLVAVISNGTAVLGLGNIGPHASKPVMEGKAVLFKKFADIDVFDIEIDEMDPDRFIDIVKSLEPTFGGINLEDIKAPECFYIEQKLKDTMDIPVFHDDQHGTAVIATAGLINAAQIAGKDTGTMKMVVSGAGAAALSCIDMFIGEGMVKENIFIFDSQGMICKTRSDLNRYKEQYTFHTKAISLDEAMEDADVFLGLSVKDIIGKKHIQSMNRDPVVFALANPDPEISYERAKSVRKDIIMSTGRSDYPNQINNVLGFPFIFRGALDCRARSITNGMKRAAAYALANIAKMDVSEEVKSLYGNNISFGRDYIIPKPFDRRVFVDESAAVLESACREGVSRINVNIEEYRKQLKERL